MTSWCQGLFPPHPFFKGKALGTRLILHSVLVENLWISYEKGDRSSPLGSRWWAQDAARLPGQRFLWTKFKMADVDLQLTDKSVWGEEGHSTILMAHTGIFTRLIAESARSGAPWARKCGKLPIRENLVITWPYTNRPPDRPSTSQAYQCKIIQSTWQPKCNSRFYFEKIAWPPGLLERKNNNKVVSFSTFFLMFTLTCITEKELERVIENKRDELCREKNMKIQSGGETMRNASGQQGAASKVKMSGSEK